MIYVKRYRTELTEKKRDKIHRYKRKTLTESIHLQYSEIQNYESTRIIKIH